MHVVEPARYRARSKRRYKWPYIAAVTVIILAVGAANYLRPLPATKTILTLTVPKPVVPAIKWPSAGQAAIAAESYGVLGSYGNQTPLATASTAKVITALCVLQKEPLAVGQTGASYTVDAQDVSIYDNYVAEDGSLLPVRQGEELTEYQALQALMIPSANNIADSLVRWVFGGQAEYASYATQFLHEHGLTDTQIGKDASGYDPSTVSTASDLTQLGLLALKSPILMQIADQATANLPAVGVVHNYDLVLGQSGITGLKTGNNDIDKGAFIFTSNAHIGNKTFPLTGAVMGETSLSVALQDSVQLSESMQHSFQKLNIASPSEKVGSVTSVWGSSSPLETVGSLQLIRWEGSTIAVKSYVNQKQMYGKVGSLEVRSGPSSVETGLKLAFPLHRPSFFWRLTRH